MNELEKKLLQSVAGAEIPRLCLRTETRVDTGGWLRHSFAWVCVMDEQLIVLAVGRRRYVQAVSLSDCHESEYCAASGTLVIAPTEKLEFNRLAMSPADALKVLECCGSRSFGSTS